MALGVEVDFTANVARFSQQVDRISGDLDRFRTRAESMAGRVKGIFSSLGVGLSVAGVGAFLKKGIDDLDAFSKAADRTGIAVETLAGISGALELADTSMQAFIDSSNRLSINIAKNSEEFENLGITAKDPAEAFLQLADAFASIEDPQQRAALGAKALGRSYAEMAPLLIQGGDALRQQIRDFQRSTGVTEEAARQSAEFNDQISKLTIQLQSLAIKAVTPIIGPLTSLTTYLSRSTDGVNDLSDAVDDSSRSWISFQTGVNTTIEFLAEISNALSRTALEVRTFWEQTKALATLDFPKFRLIDDQYEQEKARLSGDLDDLYKRVELGNSKASVEIATEATGKKLIALNDQINTTLEKIDTLESGGVKGGIAKFFGADIGAENQKLESQLQERTALIEQYNREVAQASQSDEVKTVVNVSGIEEAGDRVESVNRRIGGSARTASRSVSSAIDEISAKYNDLVADLQKQIALSGETTEAERIKYEIASGGLQQLSAAQKDYLITLAEEKDRVEATNEAYQEKQTYIASLVDEFNQAEVSFEKGLARVQDAYKEGIIDEQRAKSEFDKLGNAYNDSFVEEVKAGNDEISQYSIQAARNMQDAFADFLFDPFDSGLEGMVDSFADALRRMAANYLSSQLFDSIGSLFSSSGTASAASSAGSSSGGGFLDSLVGIVSSLFGAASANGNVFDDARLVPFATGGVFDNPTFFPMQNNQIGVLGEAGPEAIMPLARDSSGKLGIKAQGGGSYNITVNVQNGSPPDVRRAAAQGAREALGFMNRAARYG